MIPGTAPICIARQVSAAPTTSCPLVRMARRAEPAPLPTSCSEPRRAPRMNEAGQRGFTLLEMVCVLAIIAMLSAVLLPLIPRQTSRARLQAYAMEAAALLKFDRAASIRRRVEVATLIDTSTRTLRSGVGATLLRVPDDVDF